MSWKQCIALLALIVAAALGGWTIQGWRKDAQIADLKREQADGRAKGASDALNDLVGATAGVVAAAKGYVDVRNDLTTAMSAISEDLKNVQKQNPLPSGCRPDAGRLRSLQSAAAAANRAAAGTGQQPSGAMPANSGAAR